MKKTNRVFIATSIDGFIADKNGGIEWLDTIPEINQIDSGYVGFVENIDAFLFGRATYEKVLSFGIEWPYQKPVFVLSTTLKSVPNELEGKVFLINGFIEGVLSEIHKKGFTNLYIDGGKVIQNFLNEDLIDEMVITIIPILLGEGIPLFSKLQKPIAFECVESTLYLGKIAQMRYVRKRH